MARGGRAELTIDARGFNKALEALLHHVERGTKKATVAACEDIKERTLAQVPRETGALAESFSYRVIGSYKNFVAELGYGIETDTINPKQEVPSSQYMVAVHEDLEAVHANGKAKFLEDPIREYQKQFTSRAGLIIKNESGM